MALDAATGRIFWRYCVHGRRPRAAPAAVVSTAAWPSLATRCSWAPSMATWWPSTPRPAACLGHGRRETGSRLLADARPAGRQGQGHRRHRRRRVRHPRLPRGLRRQDGQGSVALQHDSGTWRTRTRHLGRRLVEAGWRPDLGHRLLRSGPQPHLLGRRQSRPGLQRRRAAGRQPLHRSVIALDADTGQLKWHYQFSPHDEFDYDATQVPVLTDLSWNGRPRKVLMFANRNGIFYVLDRATGEFLLGKPFVKVTWADGFDAKGRPQRVPGHSVELRGCDRLPRTTRVARTGTTRRSAREPACSTSRPG